MTRVLMTAFEPFGGWESNSSWQALMELTRNLPSNPEVVTRLYPVDFAAIERKLEEDLTADFDYALLLGQSSSACEINLERVALNVGSDPMRGPSSFALTEGGPAAYQSELPLENWVNEIRGQGVPVRLSHFAGDYCCNAAYYWCQHIARQKRLRTKAVFIHVPVTPRQACEETTPTPSMDSTTVAIALRFILQELATPSHELA